MVARQLEYKIVGYTLSDNIETAMNNLVPDGWRVHWITVIGETVYVVYERGSWPVVVT